MGDLFLLSFHYTCDASDKIPTERRHAHLATKAALTGKLPLGQGCHLWVGRLHVRAWPHGQVAYGQGRSLTGATHTEAALDHRDNGLRRAAMPPTQGRQRLPVGWRQKGLEFLFGEC
ncbi:hypothetical protein BHM03_00034731 [Ensete ventricosum]|nr:hypothetical protein BHM03_00034731 [Ensete ventricosum]